MNTRTFVRSAALALLLGALATAASAAEQDGAAAAAPAQPAAGREPAAPAAQTPAAQTPAAADPTAGKPAKAAAPKPADKTAKAQGKDEPGTGDFVPSEEISADYAVSFPVDI